MCFSLLCSFWEEIGYRYPPHNYRFSLLAAKSIITTSRDINLPLWSTNRWNRLLDSEHFLLPLLGKRFPLDGATGLNGRIWINAKETRHIIAASRCIEAVDPDGGGMDEAAVKKLLQTLDI